MKKNNQTSSNTDLLKNIGIIVRTIVREEVEDIVEEKLNDKLKNFPTKEEFFTRMDEVMEEVQDNRQELILQGSKISEHSDQLENHEQRINKLEQPQLLTA